MDALEVVGAFGQPVWGVFKDGEPVLTTGPSRSLPGLLQSALDIVDSVSSIFSGPSPGPDSVVALEYRQDWELSDYPVEKGGFQSYNKVQRPFDVRVRFSKGGSDAARSAFLALVDSLAKTLDTYDVVTPEKTYTNVNINHQNFARAADTAGMVIVDLWFLEIRETATQQFTDSQPLTNTQDPSGESPQSSGPVSAEAATPGQTSVIDQIKDVLKNKQW